MPDGNDNIDSIYPIKIKINRHQNNILKIRSYASLNDVSILDYDDFIYSKKDTSHKKQISEYRYNKSFSVGLNDFTFIDFNGLYDSAYIMQYSCCEFIRTYKIIIEKDEL